jgi:hypothetical protein
MHPLICPQCQTPLKEGAKFCHVCGYKIPEQEPPSQDTAKDKNIDIKDFTDVKPAEVFNAVKSGNIFTRAINIMFKPNTEWETVALEKPKVPMLIFGYSLILAIIPITSLILGYGLIGRRTHLNFGFIDETIWQRSFGTGFLEAFVFILAAFTAIIVGAVVINALAPAFKTEKNFGRAMQLTTYSFTPVFVAGTFFIVPFLSIIAHLAGLYGIFILLMGLPVVMKTPKNNQIGYFFASIGALYGIYYSIKWIF